MARAALNWSTADLAKAADVGVNTVNRFEQGQDARISSMQAMRRALETAGVIFVAENGEGPGVRLRNAPLDPAAIAGKIADLDAKAEALKHDGTPTPDNALKTMKRAVVKNEATKLRNKLAKAKSRKA